MKNKAILLVVGVIVVVAGAFAMATMSENGPVGDRPVVAATIFPIYDIVRTVAGDDVHVELLLPPGASPHTFDPTPALVRNIQQAEILFMIGYDLDEWAADIVEDGGTIEVVTLDRGITLRETEAHDDHDENEHADEDGHYDYEEDEHEEDAHQHGPQDPHYWLNPHNAATIAETIAMELGEVLPEQAEVFESRAAAFAVEVEEKITEWEVAVVPVEGVAFMTLHDAFYYLGDFATLNLVATFEPFPGREPTPRYLTELTAEIEEHNVQALFSEPQLSLAPIRAFTDDTGLALGVLDPLGGADGRDSYIALIDFNIRSLVETLQ